MRGNCLQTVGWNIIEQITFKDCSFVLVLIFKDDDIHNIEKEMALKTKSLLCVLLNVLLLKKPSQYNTYFVVVAKKNGQNVLNTFQ